MIQLFDESNVLQFEYHTPSEPIEAEKEEDERLDDGKHD